MGMDEKTTGTNEAQGDQAEVDPWVAAFASLEPKGEESAEEPAEEQGQQEGQQPASANTASNGREEVPPADDKGDDSGDGSTAGRLDTPDRIHDEQNGSAFSGVQEVTEESIKEFEEKLGKDVRNQAIKDIAVEFIKRGIRNTNGVLGATLDDPDICKRDEDGVPRFYNPETGREFSGDNPRRQAQEWVDDYNRELGRVFDNSCEQYEQHLRQQAAPKLAVMKFAPKYEKLDAIRKGMLDTIIQDYEIKDGDGKVVGYNCNLDKALAQVDRQIAMIQEYAKTHQQQQSEQQPGQPATPALDMKTSSGAVQQPDSAAPSSLAEAMERLQDAQLSKLKKN